MARQWSVHQLYSNRQDMWLSDGLTLLGNFSGLSCFPNESFAHLFPQNGRTLEVPWRPAFITVVQFIEGLPDRQAAEAVRGWIDLKYALGLELSDPGFDFVRHVTWQSIADAIGT